jgi:hypothetical protein
MARPRKDGGSPTMPLPPALSAWAEAIGDAIGRGVMRALNDGMAGLPLGNGQAATARRRGRPPREVSGGGAVPMDRRCTAEGCDREARSKGLCSAHYQAERRRLLAMAKPA